jgi:osmotically-inducible protein OsmY
MNGTYWVKQSVLAVVVAVALAAPARAAMPDAWITTKTKLALLTTEGVSGTAIHVDTILGKVTLHGKVRSAEEKAKAASDIWITSATKMRLLTDSRTPALDINVETPAGVVTLFGIV